MGIRPSILGALALLACVVPVFASPSGAGLTVPVECVNAGEALPVAMPSVTFAGCGGMPIGIMPAADPSAFDLADCLENALGPQAPKCDPRRDDTVEAVALQTVPSGFVLTLCGLALLSLLKDRRGLLWLAGMMKIVGAAGAALPGLVARLSTASTDKAAPKGRLRCMAALRRGRPQSVETSFAGLLRRLEAESVAGLLRSAFDNVIASAAGGAFAARTADSVYRAEVASRIPRFSGYMAVEPAFGGWCGEPGER